MPGKRNFRRRTRSKRPSGVFVTFWKMITTTWSVTCELFNAWLFLVKLNFGTWFYETFIDPGHSAHYIAHELQIWEHKQRGKQIKNEIEGLISEAEKGN